MKFSIQNFQSIKNLSFDFYGFTTITGSSDLGKSAILRALNALLFNIWDKRFIRRGATKTVLLLEDLPPNKQEIVSFQLEKSKSTNEYTIYFKDGTKKTYPKIGKSVPLEIMDLGFKCVDTERGDTFNLNYQGQTEPLFLIKISDVSRTSFISKVFELDRYESGLKRIAQDKIKSNREYDTANQKLIELELSLTEEKRRLNSFLLERENILNLLSQQKEIEANIIKIEASLINFFKIKEFELGEPRLNFNLALIKKVLLSLNSLDAAKEILKIKRVCQNLDTVGASIQKLQRSLNFYSKLGFTELAKLMEYLPRVRGLVGLRYELSGVEKGLQQKKETLCFLKDFVKSTGKFQSLLSEKVKIQKFKLGLSKVLDQVRVLEESKTQQIAFRVQFDDWLEGLSESKINCPLCGSLLSSNSFHVYK